MIPCVCPEKDELRADIERLRAIAQAALAFYDVMLEDDEWTPIDMAICMREAITEMLGESGPWDFWPGSQVAAVPP